MSAYLLGRIWAVPVRLQRTTNLYRWRRRFSSSRTVDGLKVLFFGTDEFASFTLSSMMDQNYTSNPPIEHIEVVCPQAIYKRRGKKEVVDWKSRAGTKAESLGIKVHYTTSRVMTDWKIPEVDERAGGGKFDIGVVSSFGSFLPERIINYFPKGMINVHPSLLPKYRGPSPIQTALLNGDTVSGVTVLEVHPQKFDAGNILAQVPFVIEPQHKRADLMILMGHVGGGLVTKVLGQLDLVRKKALVQDESKVTVTKMFGLLDGQIIWETMSAEQIMRMHRAFYGSESVYSFFRVKNKFHMIKFLELHRPNPKKYPLAPNYLEYAPGAILKARKHPYIEFTCIDGCRIHVTRFQVASKQPVDAYQFNAGYIKKSKDIRMVTSPTDTRRLTPPFVYPEGYVRPTVGDFIPPVLLPKKNKVEDEATDVEDEDTPVLEDDDTFVLEENDTFVLEEEDTSVLEEEDTPVLEEEEECGEFKLDSTLEKDT